MQHEREMTQRRRAWLPVILAIATVSLLGVGVGYANNFGSAGSTGSSGTTNGVFLANNSIHNVIQRSLTDDYTAGVTASINADYATIPGFSASTWAASACDSAGYDDCVYDSDYGNNGLNGWNACHDEWSGSHPNMVCGLAYTRINTYYAPPLMRIACHEMAHAVGLRHTDEQASCVKRTADGGDSSYLSDHDRNHVETNY